MNKHIYHCCECQKTLPLRKLKKLSDGLYCSDCQKKKRKEHMKFLKREVLGLKSRRTPEEIEASLPKINTPKIKYKVKKREKKPRDVNVLSLDEKRLLFGVLMKKGLTETEAKKRIKEIVNHLKKVRDSKGEVDVDKIFKEEYLMMVEK